MSKSVEKVNQVTLIALKAQHTQQDSSVLKKVMTREILTLVLLEPTKRAQQQLKRNQKISLISSPHLGQMRKSLESTRRNYPSLSQGGN
jgi:hypothetical protein